MPMPMRSLIPQTWNRNTPAAMRQDPFLSLRYEMDRLLDSFNSPSAGLPDISPRVDVCEADNEIDIEAELPGLDEKDIDVTLSGDMLTIRGEKKTDKQQKKNNYYVSERSYGSFSRCIGLPFDADPNKITAKFDKGVLHIAIPKPENVTAKTAKIPIKSA